MKIIFKLLFFLLINIDINAQGIIGDWIKTKITYKDGAKLSDFDIRKYRYFKFSFEDLNKFFICGKYNSKGDISFFEINSDTLQIKNLSGYVMNRYLILKLTNSELILIEDNNSRFTDNECIKYYFIKEKIYQNRLPLKPSDIASISVNDTVYKSSKKIHPVFLNDQSFNSYCLNNILERRYAKRTGKTFLASFIIRKDGIIDSVKIISKINSPFQYQFRKALAKSKDLWLPGELGEKKVDVKMEIEISFKGYIPGRFENYIASNKYSDKGVQAIDNMDYIGALKYFNLALEKDPDSYKAQYLKIICEINLGNKVSVCQDLEKLNLTELLEVDELIEKNCIGNQRNSNQVDLPAR